MASADKKMVSVDSFIFEPPSSPGGQAHLIGSRCKSCGGYTLPRKMVCFRCGGDMEVAPLPSTKGKLYSFTLNQQPMPGSAIMPPYIIAQVLLPEGVIVETVLTDADFDSLEIGRDVEMVVEKLKEDEEGNDVITFKYRPA